MIIDISHHQDPSKIDYDKLAKQIALAIIRTQYGSRTLDRHYKTHHREFQKRGVHTACYAWVRGISENDMRKEATDFYNRTKDLNPTFCFLDVEEKSMANMRAGISAYVDQLRKLGVKKIGIYIAHHLYKQFNLNLNEVDAVWIPRYGTNNGKPQTKPAYSCDIWQYTSVGRLPGYSGNLDLNKLTGTKPLEFFTGKEKRTSTVDVLVNGKNIKLKGYLKNGTNYMKVGDLDVPLRDVAELLGFKVGWNDKTKQVTIDG